MEGLRVCSLSLTFKSHLLWAHYASAWDGLAVEVELPDLSEDVHRVEYRGFMCLVDPDHHTVAEDARRVLSTKHFEWTYEQEIRIITESQSFNLAMPVRRVIAGSRMKTLASSLRYIRQGEGLWKNLGQLAHPTDQFRSSFERRLILRHHVQKWFQS